jgi:hypothetical protein
VSRSRASIRAWKETGPIGTQPSEEARIHASDASRSPVTCQTISQNAQIAPHADMPAIGHTRRLPGSRVHTVRAVAAEMMHARIGTTT